jgi:flagellar basal-body rod protein FlgF
METTTYIALSRQMVLRRKMDIIANNLANMTTSGYRSEALLAEPVRTPAGNRERLAFVQDVAVARSLDPGTLTTTGNPLDLAIDGPGYFVVETPEGERYSRGGQFGLNAAGELVTAGGLRVLDEAGAPLEIGLERGEPSVAPDGTVSTAAGVVGRLRLASFVDEQEPRRVAGGLYRTAQASAPAPAARVSQGMLEGSNVQPIVEMVEMMATVRAYEGTQRLIDAHHELQRQAIERLLRLSS